MPFLKLPCCFQDCIRLYKEYVDSFQKMKIDLQTGPERNLDFSEMYIFGKFDTFCKRLNKVRESVCIRKSKVENQCVLENNKQCPNSRQS